MAVEVWMVSSSWPRFSPRLFCPDSKAGVQTCVGVFRLLEMATLQQSFLVFAGFLGVEKEEALHLAQGFWGSEFGVGSGV